MIEISVNLNRPLLVFTNTAVTSGHCSAKMTALTKSFLSQHYSVYLTTSALFFAKPILFLSTATAPPVSLSLSLEGSRISLVAAG